MPPKKVPSVAPKNKPKARPTIFRMPRRQTEHTFITRKRREAILNLKDVNSRIVDLQNRINSLKHPFRRGVAQEIGRLELLLRNERRLVQQLSKEVLHWDDLYLEGGGPNFQPPPPPPPPGAGGGIMV